MKTTDEAIKNITKNLRFHFQIANGSDEDIRIAILPSYFANIENLTNAGFNADYILADGTLDGVKGEIVANTINASKNATISDFQRYIVTNEWQLDSMTIASDNPDAYYCDMEYAQLTPFKQQALNSFETGCHYTVDQENNDKIDIDFAEGEFILNDNLLWIVTIPASTTVKYTLRF